MVGKQLLKIQYNDIGQVKSRTSKDIQETLTWDPWGRLIEITSSNYVWKASYDALGRLLQTEYTPITKKLFWNEKGESYVTTSFYDPEHEFQEIGVKKDQETYWKIYGNSSCDAVMDTNGQTVSLIHDALGNLTGIVSEEQVLWIQELPTPYGLTSPTTESTNLIAFAKTLRWQSRSTDPTGFIWMGARYYDPVGGRFLSTDPIGHPININLYAYANGDPINFNDPDGRFFSPAFQTVQSTFINEIDGLKINIIEFKRGFEASSPFSIENVHDRSHEIFNNKLSYNIGQFIGNMNSNLTPINKILVPENPSNTTLGAIPFPGTRTSILGKTPRQVSSSTLNGKFYSVAFEVKLSNGSYPGISRASHFQEANTVLLRSMEENVQFSEMMKTLGVNLQRTATGLAPRTSPPGWTWHHAKAPGIMQLVPREQHTPGSLFWKTLHPEGYGGYSLWGQ